MFEESDGPASKQIVSSFPSRSRFKQVLKICSIKGECKCSCSSHQGKQMLDRVFDLSVNFLWESLFGPTEFCRQYWESRKFYNFTISEWTRVDSCVRRTLDYSVNLGALGQPKNVEEQVRHKYKFYIILSSWMLDFTKRIIEYKSNQLVVLDSESQTHGVMYSDYFTARNRFCISKCGPSKTRLLIHSYLNFNKRPNIIAKSKSTCFDKM